MSSATTDDAQPRTISVQLPDLLSFCSTFELRTNKHCRAVSQASEKWLIDNGAVLPSLKWHSGVKAGLLAAACFPCADATQLRFVTDFLSLLVYYDQCCGATAKCDGEALSVTNEDMFVLLSDRLSRIAYKNPEWYLQFRKSQRSYLDARHQLSQNTAVRLDLESYIELRRDASGFRMVFDMIEYAGDLVLQETLFGNVLFGKLRDHACNVVAWSEDIVSCAKGIPPKDKPNLVTTLMKERNLPLDGALVIAGTLVKQSVEAFVDSERALFASSDVRLDREAQRYVQGIRDCVAGFVNWLYETQLYLGEKGTEVRTFGWVFVPVYS